MLSWALSGKVKDREESKVEGQGEVLSEARVSSTSLQ